MATRTPTKMALPRNLHRVLTNFTIPDIASVNNAMNQVLNTLFAQYCTKVDPAGDCIVAPASLATDFRPGGKYVTEVIANAYLGDDFGLNVRYPRTDLLIAKLKPNVAIPIVGFIVESTGYGTPVSRINIYRDVNKQDLWRSVTTLLARINFIWMGISIAILPEPIIVGPGGEIAIEAEISSYYKTDRPYDIRTVVAWLPPVVFTSRSLFVAPPVTESQRS